LRIDKFFRYFAVFTFIISILLIESCYRQKETNFNNYKVQTNSSKKVTLNEYLAVNDSISYSAAVNIIGNYGEEISRVHTDAIPGIMDSFDTIMYQWVNPDGSNMTAMFQNNKLISKAQFGLK